MQLLHVQIVRTVPVEESALNIKVSDLAENFADPYANPIPDAQTVYDLILAPIADDLRQANAKTLMFSLHPRQVLQSSFPVRLKYMVTLQLLLAVVLIYQVRRILLREQQTTVLRILFLSR